MYCDSCTSGDVFAKKIVSCIKDELKLDNKDCRGQRDEGVGNMAGRYSGFSTRILQLNDLAMYTHRMSHRLNLSVASSCSIQSIKNVLDKVWGISYFFGYST